ncbi:MAG: hypothetical protein WCP62_04680, partial [Planctomycetota bacterium]
MQKQRTSTDLSEQAVLRSPRRDWLSRMGSGLGAIACAAMLRRDGFAMTNVPAEAAPAEAAPAEA